MSRSPWRYRLCPKCGETAPAGEFGWSRGNWHEDAIRHCPSCGYTANTSDFQLTSKWHYIQAEYVRLSVARHADEDQP